jgi:hypothetical protein
MARFSHLNDVFIVKDFDEKGTFYLGRSKSLAYNIESKVKP